jgi:hypothetical protein
MFYDFKNAFTVTTDFTIQFFLNAVCLFLFRLDVVQVMALVTDEHRVCSAVLMKLLKELLVVYSIAVLMSVRFTDCTGHVIVPAFFFCVLPVSF